MPQTNQIAAASNNEAISETREQILLLFDRDLRTADNAALNAASDEGSVLPAYILDDIANDFFGGAQKWWLHHSLASLSASFEELGGKLLILNAQNRIDAIIKLAQQNNITKVFWNARLGAPVPVSDEVMANELTEAGLEPSVFRGQLLHDPHKIKTGSGKYYRVYTPFWRNLSEELSRDGFANQPLNPPDTIAFVAPKQNGIALDDLALLPTKPDWSGGMAAEWHPGEAGAYERLSEFLDGGLHGYDEGRDIPSQHATSKLSAHLAFGEITPQQIMHRAKKVEKKFQDVDYQTFYKEIVWREFCYHLLVHNPEMKTRNFNDAFNVFDWNDNEDDLKAWQRGMTGYPIVDAGMRQLYQTGWMHNRVRMIVASFLTKHLLIDWRKGENWFWDTLVDADPASNTSGWQWVAGCGADASPYFRVFNPILQGEKFDKQGYYVRAFVPELKDLSAKFIHKPWDAPADILTKANITLGKNYPKPIIDHAEGRKRALAAYSKMKDTL